MAKAKTYSNRIDVLLGLTEGDVEELRKTSKHYQHRQRQLRRWSLHKARKAAA